MQSIIFQQQYRHYKRFMNFAQNIVHVNIIFHVNINKVVVDIDGEIKENFPIIAFIIKDKSH